MTIQRFCHGFCLVLALILTTAEAQSAVAETFSFSLNGLGESDGPGKQTIRGRMTLDGEEMLEPQTLDFDLSHGDQGNQHSLDVAIRNQGESILEAVLNLFDLDSNADRSQLDAKVSGDINPTDSQINVDLGEDMPGMRLKIKTPQFREQD